MSEQDLEALIARVEERGSAYLPRVNAFYVREFQMMHAAEDATRFLHQACQGLPHRLNGHAVDAQMLTERRSRAIDRVLRSRHRARGRIFRLARAVSLASGSRLRFVSRVSRAHAKRLRRRPCDQGRRREVRICCAGSGAIASAARSTTLISPAKLRPAELRRLFLAHLNEPRMARKVCAAVIAKLRAISRSRNAKPAQDPVHQCEPQSR